jgi:hypothetical protein
MQMGQLGGMGAACREYSVLENQHAKQVKQAKLPFLPPACLHGSAHAQLCWLLAAARMCTRF